MLVPVETNNLRLLQKNHLLCKDRAANKS